jgi:hypothetical protein
VSSLLKSPWLEKLCYILLGAVLACAVLTPVLQKVSNDTESRRTRLIAQNSCSYGTLNLCKEVNPQLASHFCGSYADILADNYNDLSIKMDKELDAKYGKGLIHE